MRTLPVDWSVIAAVAAVAAALTFAALLTWLALREQPGQGSQPAAPPQADQRAALIELCVELGDRIDNPALLERLTRTLAEVGVTTVPSNGLLNPALHRVIDRVLATDPALHNRIASTDRIGYVDNGRLLRPADVTVYQAG